MLIVIWKKNGMRLRVLDFSAEHRAFIVCKETAPNPMMGRFRVKVADTSASDYLTQ